MQIQSTPHSIDNLPRLSRKTINFIIANVDEDISLDQLSTAAGMSKFNFCRKFQNETGLTPVKWLWVFRARLAAEFIAIAPNWSLTDIAFRCGFSSSAHFSRLFKQINGTSPTLYKKKIVNIDKQGCSHYIAADEANTDLIEGVALKTFSS